jgi:hypothetical protein
MFVALNHGKLPIRAPSDGELAEWLRRAEDYATLGARVVELHSESHAAKPSTCAWAIARRADRGHRRQADRASRTERLQRSRAQTKEREVAADRLAGDDC